MKMFKNSTKKSKCDRCGDTIKKNDKAYCFHSTEEEVYICMPCVRDVYNEYVKFNGDGILKEQENPIEE